MRALALAIVAGACSGSHAPRARVGAGLALAELAPATLCVTHGALAGDAVEVPTFRAVAPGHGGDAAELEVVVHGEPARERALASGQHRRQLGLKLRAEDGCNLVYVMWRLDPRPELEVSVKRNPGARNHDECGAEGYTKVRPDETGALPVLDDGAPHTLRAAIDGDRLVAWVDGRVAWRGTLPAEAAGLHGPAGVRSDNLAFELRRVAVDPRPDPSGTPPVCRHPRAPR